MPLIDSVMVGAAGWIDDISSEKTSVYRQYQ